MKRKTKFWIYSFFGTVIFTPFFIVSVLTKLFVFAAMHVAWFLMFCYLNYQFVYKKAKAKYPLAPPEGRTDVYFPRTNIPRPIHDDVRRYPEAFGKKRKLNRKAQKTRNIRKKKT
ncbi:MAG: hypothetical protein QXG76_04885 [Candidatus Bathyarchaeia archaeon]